WGILRGDVFETLGIPEEKIKQAKEKVKENQRLFNEIMNRNKNGPGIDQLPHSWMSPAKKPVIALQGDGVILATDAKNKNDAIYTFGAGPCAILTVTAKDDKGNVKKWHLLILIASLMKQIL
ncbi:MAG: hypothetical protein QW171_03105, partial [Candidatus Bilamarchaeaceae archaeon]